MEELIARVTQATGLDQATAKKAIGLILGFLKKEGPPDEVARDPRVKAVYLGEGADV